MDRRKFHRRPKPLLPSAPRPPGWEAGHISPAPSANHSASRTLKPRPPARGHVEPRCPVPTCHSRRNRYTKPLLTLPLASSSPPVSTGAASPLPPALASRKRSRWVQESSSAMWWRVVRGRRRLSGSRPASTTAAAAEKACRAVVVPRFGGPEVLEIRQGVPVPDLKPREVLVRARAVSINPLDLRVSPSIFLDLRPSCDLSGL